MKDPQELRHLKISPNPVYKKVSIVIPIYNEKRTIQTILDVVSSAPVHNLDKEIILIDDKSTDGTAELLKTFRAPDLKVILQEKNAGKGTAVQAGFKEVSGDIVIIQDADLEYDPHDYAALIAPFLTDLTDIHTCYITFNRKVLNEIGLEMTSKRFGFNPEFAARIAKKHYKIIEVPISYYPRTKAQGKKIGFKDALDTVWATIKYNLFTK